MKVAAGGDGRGTRAYSTCHTIKRTSLKGAGYKAKNFQQQRGQKTSKRTSGAGRGEERGRGEGRAHNGGERTDEVQRNYRWKGLSQNEIDFSFFARKRDRLSAESERKREREREREILLKKKSLFRIIARKRRLRETARLKPQNRSLENARADERACQFAEGSRASYTKV